MWGLSGNIPQYFISQAALCRYAHSCPFPPLERNLNGIELENSVAALASRGAYFAVKSIVGLDALGETQPQKTSDKYVIIRVMAD